MTVAAAELEGKGNLTPGIEIEATLEAVETDGPAIVVVGSLTPGNETEGALEGVEPAWEEAC